MKEMIKNLRASYLLYFSSEFQYLCSEKTGHINLDYLIICI